jgi:hypothetical protein
MRKQTGKFLEKCRITNGPLPSDKSMGFNGAFFIPYAKSPDTIFKVVCSDGSGWEHVSVSLPKRCPTWEELCWIKELFWEDEEAVMQLHPPKSTWVNNMRFCLHLWSPTKEKIPLPSQFMVGIKELGTIDELDHLSPGLAEVARFAKERNEVFSSLDFGRIRAFMAKHKMHIPEEPEVFERMVHLVIANSGTGIDEDIRTGSITWLMSRGLPTTLNASPSEF